MKIVMKVIAAVIVLAFINISYSQTVDESYEVGTWPGFKSAAISFTFDDNCSNQLAVIVPMFDEFDFKVTLFTVTTWSPNWTGLKEAAANGHEIASHTVTHAYLNQISEEEQVNELENSYNTINTNIPEQTALTIAYPYCVIGNSSLPKEYYIGGRGCQGSVESKTPSNLMNISSIICGSEGSVKTAQNFKSKSDIAVNKNGLCVYLIHGVDDDGGWSPTESSVIREHLEYLKENEDKFWVPTFIDVVRYIRERNSVSVTETSAQDTSISLQISDTLDNDIYNLPVTIRRVLPDGWSSCNVMQNEESIPSQVVEIDSVKYIMFDVAPDNGDILLIKSGVTGIGANEVFSTPSSFALQQNYPNPFNPSTHITYSISNGGYVSLLVYDVLGREVAKKLFGYQSAGRHSITFNEDNLSGGVYFYKLKYNNHFSKAMKMVLMK